MTTCLPLRDDHNCRADAFGAKGMEPGVSCPNLNGPFNPMKNEKCALTLLEVGNAARGNETGVAFAGRLHIRCKR